MLSSGRAGVNKKRKADDGAPSDVTPPVAPVRTQETTASAVEDEHTILSTFEPERPTQPAGKSSLRYHSRPLTLTTEMLRLAFAPEPSSAYGTWIVDVDSVQDA